MTFPAENLMRFGSGFVFSSLMMTCVLVSSGCRPKTPNDSISPSAWRALMFSAGTFRNPIVGSGADPWVVPYAGSYYYCFSNGRNSIFVSKAESFIDIGRVPAVKVWEAPQGTEHARQVWAPELHFLDGRWYIYYAASDGDNDTHRMFVLESQSSDPTGPYQWKGKIAAATDRWAIDGTVLDAGDGLRYFVWSGWDAEENIQQNLYIAPMLNPWTLVPPDPTVLRLEAEQANVQGGKLRTVSGASGGLAIGKLDSPESFIEFSVDMPQSGTYQMDVRYASGSESPGSHELLVNGVRQTLSYPPSGWNNFQTVQAFVPLVAGANRLRFVSAQGFVELDKVEIKKLGSARA
jgi:hypothetical protein